MIRSTLTDQEVDLLTNMGKACKYGLRLGLAEGSDRARLEILSVKIIRMVGKIGSGE